MPDRIVKVDVLKIAQGGPDDLTGLRRSILDGSLDPSTIIAIMGKTEGNGCVNDFTRGFAVATLEHYFSDLVSEEQASQIVYIMSGGTEGVLSPHLTVFTRQEATPGGTTTGGLALGVHHTRDFSVGEIGSLAMVDVVADGVQAAMSQAAILMPDVHFVQIKCPLITANDRQDADTSGDSYKSMAHSRAASALGIAAALGEIDRGALSEDQICADFTLHSAVASTSAGSELRNCEILVLGNAASSQSDLRIGHSVMDHALDRAVVDRALASAESQSPGGSEIVNVFAKAEASPTGEVLGARHTMLDDSDISHTRMARAVVGSVLAAEVQDPMIYVSGGSEHQGPPGGGPVAVITRALEPR